MSPIIFWKLGKGGVEGRVNEKGQGKVGELKWGVRATLSWDLGEREQVRGHFMGL
jgi:hypothetical protein